MSRRPANAAEVTPPPADTNVITIDPKTHALAVADLHRSGLTPECLRDGTGIRVLTASEAQQLDPTCPWWRHAPDGLPCLLFEYRHLDGTPSGIWRLRRLADAPPSFGSVLDLPRYHQAKGSRPGVWFPSCVDWRELAKDPSKRIVIVEGEKKAEALCRVGIPAVGLGGVWNTGSKKRRIDVLPELLGLDWSDRPVVVLFDTDEKPRTRIHVAQATTRVGDLLRSQGAEPFKATLPQLDGEKTGADDFLVAKDADALLEVIEAAVPLFPAEDLTDVGNALRLARRAAGLFLYVPKWKGWLRWDGRRWAPDDRAEIRELAVEVVKDMLLEARREPDADRQKKLVAHAMRSQGKRLIDAMVELAPSVWASLKAAPDDFDRDPWVLNAANGTIDLRTGVLRASDPDDLITMLAPVEYDPAAPGTLWNAKLREILPDDGERGFLQRALGYCLTGSVREEKLFFLQGSGRNGKGVTIETVLAVLGDYGGTAPEALLLAKKFDSHPTELADLRGKRLVVANEVGQGRTWNAARLKMLTGGDRVKARRMHENFWEYEPSHKFIVLGNARPRADSDDAAFWERLKLIPFEQSFAARPDMTLKARLRAELRGVLRWLVEGCLAWQRDGLGEPPKIREAIAEYRAEQRDLDPLGGFLKSFAPIDASGRPLGDLLEAYNRFVPIRAQQLSAHELGQKLRGLGYTVERGAKGVRMVRRNASKARRHE